MIPGEIITRSGDIELNAGAAHRPAPTTIAVQKPRVLATACHTLNFATSATCSQPSSNERNGMHHNNTDENAI